MNLTDRWLKNAVSVRVRPSAPNIKTLNEYGYMSVFLVQEYEWGNAIG
jgi:hypothetical protein